MTESVGEQTQKFLIKVRLKFTSNLVILLPSHRVRVGHNNIDVMEWLFLATLHWSFFVVLWVALLFLAIPLLAPSFSWSRPFTGLRATDAFSDILLLGLWTIEVAQVTSPEGVAKFLNSMRWVSTIFSGKLSMVRRANSRWTRGLLERACPGLLEHEWGVGSFHSYRKMQ